MPGVGLVKQVGRGKGEMTLCIYPGKVNILPSLEAAIPLLRRNATPVTSRGSVILLCSRYGLAYTLPAGMICLELEVRQQLDIPANSWRMLGSRVKLLCSVPASTNLLSLCPQLHHFRISQ